MNPEKIKSLRIKLDLNQQNFADLLKVSKRSVANYESGNSKPNARTLVKLKNIDSEVDETNIKSKYYSKDQSLEEIISERIKQPVTREEIDEINIKLDELCKNVSFLVKQISAVEKK